MVVQEGTPRAFPGGRIWPIVLIAAVAVAALAGIALYLRSVSAPCFVRMDNWEWRRTGKDAAGNIEGVLILTGGASGRFSLTGVACNEAPLGKQPGLPRQVKEIWLKSYKADIRMVIPEVTPPKRPLNLVFYYQQRKKEGQLVPIVLYP